MIAIDLESKFSLFHQWRFVVPEDIATYFELNDPFIRTSIQYCIVAVAIPVYVMTIASPGFKTVVSVFANTSASKPSNTSELGFTRPASPSARPRAIEASSAAYLASRSQMSRTPSRSTSFGVVAVGCHELGHEAFQHLAQICAHCHTGLSIPLYLPPGPVTIIGRRIFQANPRPFLLCMGLFS